jgi:zinc protease
MALIGRKRRKRGYRSVALACSLASVWAVLACEEPSGQAVAPTAVAPPVAPLVAPPAADLPLYDPSAFRHHRLDNGLEMMLFENRSAPTVSLGFQVRRGAGSVDPKRAGLARFTATLMNQGAGERDGKALLREVRDQSATLEIGTWWDVIGVEIEGPADNIDSLIAILADVVMRPQLRDEQAQALGSLLLANMQQSGDRPKDLQQRLADRVLYPNHRAGLPLEGNEETLVALTAEDARDFYSQVFIPNNLTFFAVGSFDADDLVAQVTGAFGSWAPGPIDDQDALRFRRRRWVG